MKTIEKIFNVSAIVGSGGLILGGIALATKNSDLMNAGLIMASASSFGALGYVVVGINNSIKKEKEKYLSGLNKGFVEGYYGA